MFCPNAIDAEFKLSIKDGSIIRYLNTRSKIMCWLDSYDPIRIEKIINGEALKIVLFSYLNLILISATIFGYSGLGIKLIKNKEKIRNEDFILV